MPSAIIFDCDGVLLESEELHRLAYNDTFAAEQVGVVWSYEYYARLQNSVGGGKAKFRHHFDAHGWPAATQFDTGTEAGREAFLARLHECKSQRYAERIRSGGARLRPGIGRLIDEAAARGLRLAVCSAANARSVRLVLDELLDGGRLAQFELVLAGDAVPRKKPDPMIYEMALERLALPPRECVVIEDSRIGLDAARAAGIRCVITRTPYTAAQTFDGAAAVFGDLDRVSLDEILAAGLTTAPSPQSSWPDM